MNSAGSIVMSIFATLTASFISASFVVFVIAEKKSKVGKVLRDKAVFAYYL